MSTLDLFCEIDSCCQEFEVVWHQQLVSDGIKKRRRLGTMSLSKMMIIVIYFHQVGYRNFKTLYLLYVQKYLRGEFLKLLSYTRFVPLMPHLVTPMSVYLQTCSRSCTGISFIDSTSLVVCHNRRISQHRVFKETVVRGKTSTEWFFGFKLHLMVNEIGDILGCCVTPANVGDRQLVPSLTAKL